MNDKLREQLADDILWRIAKRYANCEVYIYPDLPELTPVEGVLRCAQEEGIRFVIGPPALPEKPAAPPVLQAEPCDMERAVKFNGHHKPYQSLTGQTIITCSEGPCAMCARLLEEFAAIRREASCAAFEKAAQIMRRIGVHGDSRGQLTVAEALAEIVALADSPVSGDEKEKRDE